MLLHPGYVTGVHAISGAPVTWLEKLVAVGKTAGLIVVSLAVIFGVSIALVSIPTSGDYEVAVKWPSRMSASVPGTLLVTVGETEDYTRKPVPGVDVVLHEPNRGEAPKYPSNEKIARLIVSGDLKEIARGKTDAAGIALLTIPPRAQETELIVVVGDEVYRYERYDAPSSGRVLVTTDRPLYQPGQRIKVRALITDQDTGAPLERELRWELRDPQGNLVVQRKGKSSQAGVASTEFPLASQCRQGSWQIQVHVPQPLPVNAGKESRPSAKRPEITVTERVDVRPFRLPRFKVSVELDNAEYTGKQELAGKVKAITTYGEPVKDAEIEVALTWRRVGAPAAPVGFKGKTGADGTFPIKWAVPASVAPGSSIGLSAIVTSKAGRAERGTTSARVPGGDLRVELISENGWLNGVEATGFVVLTKPGGAPLGGARIDLALPERQEERTLTLTSDEHGQAEFQWAARSARVRVKVTPDGGAPVTRDINVPVRYGSWWIKTDTMRVEADKPFKYSLEAPGRPKTQALSVLALRDGYPIAHARGDAGSMTLGMEAAGLVTLVAHGEAGNEIARTTVWVSGPEDALTMALDKEEYRPGTTAKLDMQFSGATTPVTYSLVAVDEALYALKERTNLPLSLLLHESPSRIKGVAAALAPLDKQGNALTARISASRARQSLTSLESNNTRYGRDLTVAVGRARLQPITNAWMVVLGLLILLLGFVAARFTWRAFEKRSFTWSRLFAMIGVALAAVVLPMIVIGIFDDEFGAGAISMWYVLVLCWIVAAAWRTDMRFGSFLWTLVGIGVVAGAVTVTSEAKPSEWAVVVATVCALIPVGLLGVELILWSFALFQRFERRAALGLTTVAASILGLTLAITLTMGGGMSKFEPDMAVQSMAPSPMSTGGSLAEEEAGDDAPAERAKKVEGKARAPAAPPPEPPGTAGPRVRSWFPETMVWLPEVAAEANGSKSLTLEIPDSITTWRLDATAHARDGRAGQARAGMRVVKPFFVEIDAPTDLTVGDTAQIPVTLINRGKAPLRVRVDAKPRDGLHGAPDGTVPSDFNSPQQIGGFGSPTPLEMVMAPGEQSLQTVSIKAFAAGEATLTVSARVEGGEGDAVKRTIRIRPDGREISVAKAGFVGDGFKQEAPQTFQGGGHTQVSLFAGIGPQALDGLDGMLRGPTGCFEQTSSANFPNVVVSQLLAQTPTDKWPGGAEKYAKAKERADEFLVLGYQRMMTFQASDGGFSLYPEKKSDTLLTAYGLMQLTEMKKVMTIDERIIERAAFYLVQRQRVRGNWPVFAGRVAGGKYGNDGDPAQLRASAFIVWALADSSQADTHRAVIDKALDWLEKNTDETAAADTLGWVANALIAGKRPEAAKKLLGRLVAKVKRDGDRAWWPASAPTWIGGWGRYADIESTALAVYAMLRAEAQGELLQPSLRWLAAQRSPRGGWGTTQATVWGLRVFRELNAGATNGPARFQVQASGQPMLLTGEGEVEELTIEPGDQVVRRFHAGGVRPVSVTSTPKSNVLAQADWTYAVPWNSPAAKVEGERLDVKVQHAPAVGRAEQVTMVVEVINRSRDLYGATIVELPVPPGAYVPQDDFESLQKGGAIDRFEVLPTHVRLYLSEFGPGSRRVFEYPVVPLVRGAFSLPPARAYIFYAPDPISETDAGDLVVR